MRRSGILSPNGQPGGLDDPLSKGLSGAGVCRYLINLEEGMTPEEARKKAVGRKITQEQPPQGLNPKKRGAYQITPQQGLEHIKRKFLFVSADSAATRTHTSYGEESASLIKVAVIPREPEASLSAEEAIVEKMLRGSECKLKFTSIHFRPGMLVVNVVDKSSAEWLVEKAPQLVKSSGIELRACQ